MLNYITEFGKDVVKIATDIITFGYANTAKVKEKRARGEFDQWVANNLENPEFAERIKDPKEKEKMFEEFLEMKRANMRAALNEFRMIILLMMLLRSLGDDDDTGDDPWDDPCALMPWLAQCQDDEFTDVDPCLIMPWLPQCG